MNKGTEEMYQIANLETATKQELYDAYCATRNAADRLEAPSRERRVIDCRELDKYLGEGWREAKDAMPPLRMAIVER